MGGIGPQRRQNDRVEINRLTAYAILTSIDFSASASPLRLQRQRRTHVVREIMVQERETELPLPAALELVDVGFSTPQRLSLPLRLSPYKVPTKCHDQLRRGGLLSGRLHQRRCDRIRQDGKEQDRPASRPTRRYVFRKSREP